MLASHIPGENGVARRSRSLRDSAIFRHRPGRRKANPERAKISHGLKFAPALSIANAMTEVLFYHLQRQPLDRVLPALLEKSLARGWRIIVQASSDERVDALDAHLWTYRDDGFLPHGTYRESDAAAQPVLLTIHDHNPNSAHVRFLVDGAAMPADAAAYQRIVLLFDGTDEDAVAQARERWSAAKSAGFDVTYWQPDEKGRWLKKA
jgi:DNA polymerase III subunit chi